MSLFGTIKSLEHFLQLHQNHFLIILVKQFNKNSLNLRFFMVILTKKKKKKKKKKTYSRLSEQIGCTILVNDSSNQLFELLNNLS
jgi:hypothetical protein